MNFSSGYAILFLMLLIFFIPGTYGIEITVSGGCGDGSSSVSMNINVAKEAVVNSEITINEADIRPSTSITGKTMIFEEIHQVTEKKSGKTAQAYVKVVNAPTDICYRSKVLPKEGNVKNQPLLSAEQWLTVSKADSIACKESASFGALMADVGLEMVKGSVSEDFVTLSNYHGKAYASVTDVYATQKATEGSANSIRIYGHANDGGGPLSVDTTINSVSGLATSFRGLDAGSFAGTTTKVIQKEHVTGDFTSTATSGAGAKTRESNYGTEYDVDMQAKERSAPTGILGYYVNPRMTNLIKGKGAIEGAVSVAASGDTINAASGTYYENVQIDKSLTVNGAGAGNTIVDGSSQAGSVFTIGKNNPNVDVTLSGITITNGKSGGLYNRGTLTLNNLKIADNTATWGGGGIYNDGGMVKMNHGSSITGNTAIKYGGGIFNNGGTVNMNHGSSIYNNKASTSGGGIYSVGTVNMYGGSSISKNAAQSGGGIMNCGMVNMYDTSFISKNIAASETWGGGGISNPGGTVNMYGGSSISKNTAANNGGGINSIGGTVNMYGGSSISKNTANNGGGIYNYIDTARCSTVNMYDGSSVSKNTANKGGGIYNLLGTVNMYDGSSISKNTANNGGGIYNVGDVNDNGGVISNTPDDIV